MENLEKNSKTIVKFDVLSVKLVNQIFLTFTFITLFITSLNNYLT